MHACRLAGLLGVLRQHLRRWLPDLVGLVHEFWGAGPGMLPVLLELVTELASVFSCNLPCSGPTQNWHELSVGILPRQLPCGLPVSRGPAACSF